MTGGKLTVTLDVEGYALKELRASDDNDNVYEVSFHIKKPGAKNPPLSQSAKGDNATGVSAAAGDALTTAGGAGGAHQPGGPGDDKDHDNECQCCTLIGGRLSCATCPCPEQP